MLSRTRRARQPSPEKFGPDFFVKVYAAYRQCGRVRRVVIVTALAVAIAGAATQAGGFAVLGLLVSVGALITRPPADPADGLPTDEDLASVDAARELDDLAEFEASGIGRRDYDRAVSRLQGLLHRHVTVLFGGESSTASGDWRPVIRVQGELHDAVNESDSDDELLKFSVGDGGSFYLDEGSFARGDAISRNGDSDELMLVLDDGVTLFIFETTASSA